MPTTGARSRSCCSISRRPTLRVRLRPSELAFRLDPLSLPLCQGSETDSIALHSPCCCSSKPARRPPRPAVKQGDRVAQLILERIVTPEVQEVDSLAETVRGAGGFGSTGGFGVAAAAPEAAEASTGDVEGPASKA